VVEANYCVLGGCLLPLSFCSRGFQDLLKVRPSSLLMLCGCISSSAASLFMFCQGCGREASPSGMRRQFLGETVASKLKGNTGTVLNRSSDKIFSSAGHNGFSCDC
jgi:hypothetical protein